LDGHRNHESLAVLGSSYEDANALNVTAGVDTFGVADATDAVIDATNEKISIFYQAHRTETTLQALQIIANHLAGLPGRKNLIWLSSGFPMYVGQGNDGTGIATSKDFQSFGDAQRNAWRAINDMGVAIYPVDARGMIGMDGRSPSMLVSSQSRTSKLGPPAVDKRAQDQIDASQGVMRELAERTGGRAFLNSNDVAGSIRRAMDDSRVSYVLYYTPSHDEWNGQFRDIKIKLNRPGLEARYRNGYYAMADLPTDSTSRQTALASAGIGPLISTGLTLLAKLIEKPTEAAPQAVLSVSMDPHDIHFGRNAQGEIDGTVDLLLLVFGSQPPGDQPTPLNQTSRTVHLTLKQQQFDQIMKNGVRLTLTVDAPAKFQRVRVVARDAASGQVGSLDIPIK
jgi:VWFA-related protein